MDITLRGKRMNKKVKGLMLASSLIVTAVCMRPAPAYAQWEEQFAQWYIEGASNYLNTALSQGQIRGNALGTSLGQGFNRAYFFYAQAGGTLSRQETFRQFMSWANSNPNFNTQLLAAVNGVLASWGLSGVTTASLLATLGAAIVTAGAGMLAYLCISGTWDCTFEFLLGFYGISCPPGQVYDPITGCQPIQTGSNVPPGWLGSACFGSECNTCDPLRYDFYACLMDDWDGNGIYDWNEWGTPGVTVKICFMTCLGTHIQCVPQNPGDCDNQPRCNQSCNSQCFPVPPCTIPNPDCTCPLP